MDVAMLRWPAQDAQRQHHHELGLPRLLVIDHGLAPPPALDCLEDWVRPSDRSEDVEVRLRTLLDRTRAHGGQPPRRAEPPRLDEHGVLRNHRGWVSLPTLEARLATALLERYGAVVSREALMRTGWPQGCSGRNALDVHVLRLRRRITPLALAIKTVRSRGYLLEAA